MWMIIVINLVMILGIAPFLGSIISTLRWSPPFKSVLHYLIIFFLIGNGICIWGFLLPEETSAPPSKEFYVIVAGFILWIASIGLACFHENIDEYIKQHFKRRTAFNRHLASSRKIRPAVRPSVRSMTSKELKEVAWYALNILGKFIYYEILAFAFYYFTPSILGVSKKIGGTLLVGGSPIALIFFSAALGAAAYGVGILFLGTKETINRIKKYRTDSL